MFISAAYSAKGPPAVLVKRWRAGEFEIVVSEELLGELAQAFSHAKIQRKVAPDEAAVLIGDLRAKAEMGVDVGPSAVHSRDRTDDYLLGLAQSTGAILVTGDRDLLALTELPIETPRAFLQRLVAFEEGRGSYRLTGSRATRRAGRPRSGRSRRAVS